MGVKLQRPAQAWLDHHGAGHDEFRWKCPSGICGDHRVIIRAGARYKGPVWGWNGSLEAPTFSPSLLITWTFRKEEHGIDEKNVCHFFVKEGKVEFLSDCTHALAGKTVPMEDV
jgi:hypothetical protein